MRNLPFLALLFTLPLAAQLTPMPPATLAELARADVAPPAVAHRAHARPHAAAKRAPLGATIPDLVLSPNAVAAPPVTLGFKATSNPLPGTTNGVDPADPGGAVGPHHVVGAFNNSITVHDRGGNQLAIIAAAQFWHDATVPDLLPFAPRVLYDTAADRWIIAMLGEDNNEQNGVLFFATSASGDPTGTWHRYRIPISTDTTISGDIVRMVMTGNLIVITTNEWAGNDLKGADVFDLPRSSVYSSPSVRRTHFPIDFELIPVASTDNAERFFTTAPGFPDQFQLDASGNKVNFESWAYPPGFGYTQWTCGQLGLPNSIDCGLGEPYNALLRDGVEWVAATANDGSRSAVIVWKIVGAKATTYELHDPAFDYSFPSVAVNRAGTALVGYAVFSLNTFPSAEYRIVDAAGTVSAPVAVKSGEDLYEGLYWGDYSTTVVDPADDSSFWTLQMYSTPPVNLKFFTWGTWWSYVRVAPTPGRPRAVRH